MVQKKTRSAREISTKSSSSAGTGKSNRRRAVSAIGREIEQSLALSQSNDLLSRWMSYRLAEIRRVIEDESVDSDARKTALAEQDSLVMSLWERREALPHRLAVDKRVKPAARIIESILAEPRFWRRPSAPSKNPEEVLDAIKCTFTYLVTVIAALRYKRLALVLGAEDPDLPLDDEEKKERVQWEKLVEKILRSLDPSLRARRPSESSPGLLADSEAVALLEKVVADEILEMEQHLAELKKHFL